MMAHHAWFCSDIVGGITSYLPTADVLSLVYCGNKILNRLLRIHTTYSLSYTTRDIDILFVFWHLFKNIRYVYIGCETEFTYGFKMSKQIQRFVAPNVIINNFKFRSSIQYIDVKCAFYCSFYTPPEKYMMRKLPRFSIQRLTNEHSSFHSDKYVTHFDLSESYDPIVGLEDLYPHLQETTIAECPNKIHQNTNIKMNYVCNYIRCNENFRCCTCGAIMNSVSMHGNRISTLVDGIKRLSVDDIYDDSTFDKIPSSVTSVRVQAYLSYEQICNFIQSLPETVVDISISTNYITPSQLSKILLSFNKSMKSLNLQYNNYGDVTFGVCIVASVCRKIQFDTLTIKFDYNCYYDEGDTVALAGNYHLIFRNNTVIFERIRARA